MLEWLYFMWWCVFFFFLLSLLLQNLMDGERQVQELPSKSYLAQASGAASSPVCGSVLV